MVRNISKDFSYRDNLTSGERVSGAVRKVSSRCRNRSVSPTDSAEDPFNSLLRLSPLRGRLEDRDILTRVCPISSHPGASAHDPRHHGVIHNSVATPCPTKQNKAGPAATKRTYSDGMDSQGCLSDLIRHHAGTVFAYNFSESTINPSERRLKDENGK